MNIEFKVPELGENITSGDIVNVLVHEGQTILANDGVVELETDKAVVEIPCPYAGRITKIAVKKGDAVKVGQTILILEGEEEQTPKEPADMRAKAPVEPTAAPSAPPAQKEVKETAPVRPSIPALTTKAVAPAPVQVGQPIPAGPAARRLARELSVDLGTVQGSGARGRITPEDVQAAAGTAAARPGVGGAAAAKAPPKMVAPYEPVVPPGEPGRDAWGEIRRERMSRIRQTIAAQMARSASIIPHLTNFDDADITDLEAVRASVPPGFLGGSLKLTQMPLVIKAVALALRRHPALNACLDEENQQIVYKQYVNIGIAVDTPRGLVVPALRDADRLSIVEIARQLTTLAERARGAQFGVEELRGGTFTISNLGAVGGAYSTPIINHPEVAILLLGRARLLPVVREGRIEPRMMLPLSLSYDHRVVDGAAASRFLNEVIDWLQSPGRLLLVGG